MGYSSADGSYGVAFGRLGVGKPVESTAHTLDGLLGLKLPKLVVGDTQLLQLARTKEVADTGFTESVSVEINGHCLIMSAFLIEMPTFYKVLAQAVNLRQLSQGP